MTKTKTFWAGFVDGRPDFLFSDDDRRSVIDLFRSKKNAQCFFDDVRRVTVTWEDEG